MQIPSGMQLADPSFHQSGEVNILLGANVFWRIIGSGQIKTHNNEIHLQQTSLGWLVVGTLNQAINTSTNRPISCNLSLRALDQRVRQFWEIDQWPAENNKELSQEENMCE